MEFGIFFLLKKKKIIENVIEKYLTKNIEKKNLFGNDTSIHEKKIKSKLHKLSKLFIKMYKYKVFGIP